MIQAAVGVPGTAGRNLEWKDIFINVFVFGWRRRLLDVYHCGYS
jgi:hypothetical protein